MNFEIAKAIRIPNHKFDTPIYMSMKLAQTISSTGAKYVAVSHVSPTVDKVSLLNALNRGDVLTITSSHSDYEGQTEQVIVERAYYDSASALYFIVFQNSISNLYAIEDCIKGYGTGWPDSWNHRYAVYNKFSNTAINPPGGGFSDNYCFFLSNNENATGVVESDELEFDEWPEYCFLRAGFFIKQDVASGASASRVTLYLSDGLSLMTKYYAVSSDVTDWEEITATGVPFITSPNLANYINGTLNRSLKGAYRIDVSSSSRHNVFLDDVYVEHIRDISPHAETSDRVVPAGSNTFFPLVGDISEFVEGSDVYIWGLSPDGDSIQYDHGNITSGGILDNSSYKGLGLSGITNTTGWSAGARLEQANLGYYTFTENPEIGSVTPKKTENIVKYRNSNNNLRWANVSGWGERSSKNSLTMRFDNVPYTFFKKLKKFEEYCLQGGIVNLHLKDNVPEMHQGFLQGLLSLSPAAKNMWNRENCSFTFLMEEI